MQAIGYDSSSMTFRYLIKWNHSIVFFLMLSLLYLNNYHSEKLLVENNKVHLIEHTLEFHQLVLILNISLFCKRKNIANVHRRNAIKRIEYTK